MDRGDLRAREKSGVSWLVNHHERPGCSRGKAAPPMLSMLDNDTDDEQNGFKAELDELILKEPGTMLLAVIEAEAADYVERH